MSRIVVIASRLAAVVVTLATGPAQSASFFQTEVAPIFEEKCAICHLTGQEAGNISLVADDAIASLVGIDAIGAPHVKRVVPGAPDESYLIRKLEGTHGEVGGLGQQMPFGGPPLSRGDIAKVRQWIMDGAKP